MIIASNYSTRVTRLLGTQAVSVLATLVLLSYTKILRVLITAFSFTILTGSQDFHSVVWLADGNIKYFQPKHILFLVALLVLLLLGVPYTVTLTAARGSVSWCSWECVWVMSGTEYAMLGLEGGLNQLRERKTNIVTCGREPLSKLKIRMKKTSMSQYPQLRPQTPSDIEEVETHFWT